LIFFPIPFISLSFPDDKKFADALCEKDKEAGIEFQDLYSDELYFVSARFNNRGTPQESWNYRTKTGYNINVSDSVSDTYVWLFNNIVLNKSCHFRGDDGASFEAYIKTVLNSEWTFIGWLRWKTDDSLIRVPGATGYVPKVIKRLGDPIIDIYKLLRQNKSKDAICKKLDLEKMDVDVFYNQIEACLIDSNQLQLINAPRFTSTDSSQFDDDEGSGIQLAGETELAPEKTPEVEAIKDLIASVIKYLTVAENRMITLWGNGYSADQIFDEFSTRPFLEKFKTELHLESAADVFPLIEKIITKSVKFVKKDHSDLQMDYNLDNSRMKKLLKTYFNYFT